MFSLIVTRLVDYVFFCLKKGRKLLADTHLQLLILKPSNQTRNLGVEIDSDLTRNSNKVLTESSFY